MLGSFLRNFNASCKKRGPQFSSVSSNRLAGRPACVCDFRATVNALHFVRVVLQVDHFPFVDWRGIVILTDMRYNAAA
jgi:hypothetical protein